MSIKLRILVAAIICVLQSSAVMGGERIRSMEFSISGAMQAIVARQKAAEPRQSFNVKDETEHYLSVPVRIGTFVTPHILVEAEGIFTMLDERFWGVDKPGYIVSLNGSYNFHAGENMLPFVLLGAGISNGLPFANGIVGIDEDGPKPLVLNYGAGVKFLISPKAALRVEYRLQNFNGSKDYERTYDNLDGTTETITYTEKTRLRLHSMFIGVSLFF